VAEWQCAAIGGTKCASREDQCLINGHQHDRATISTPKVEMGVAHHVRPVMTGWWPSETPCLRSTWTTPTTHFYSGLYLVPPGASVSRNAYCTFRITFRDCAVPSVPGQLTATPPSHGCVRMHPAWFLGRGHASGPRRLNITGLKAQHYAHTICYFLLSSKTPAFWPVSSRGMRLWSWRRW